MDLHRQQQCICEVCDRVFRTERALRLHEKQVHTCHTDIQNSPDVCLPSSLSSNESVQELGLKILEYQPVVGMSHVGICNDIGSLNNMSVVTVPDDGSCQYHAVIEGP